MSTHGRTLAFIVLSAVVLCAFTPARAIAQPAPAPAPSSASGGGLKELGTKVIDLFNKPVHPIVKSVGPGGGFGPGIAYTRDRKTGGPWLFRTEAVITPRKYWNVEGNLQYQNDWLHGEGYGRAREMTRLDFYGLGTGSRRDDRTTFRYLDRSVGALVSARPSSFDLIAVGGRVERLWPDVGPGKNNDYPSIEERFTETSTPGVSLQPGFVATTGFVNVNYPGGNALGRHGADVQVAYSAYRDLDQGRDNFNRLNLESQQRVRGAAASHLITFHEWFSSSMPADGGSVPFFLQHTLGGAGAVRSVGEEILGSDATKATLRGFEDLRFRGPHLLLLQAEYRFKVKGPIDATLFADAGQVTRRRGDLSIADMRGDAGVSVSFMTIDATALRVDIGGGGGEGVHVFFSVGPIFQR